MKNTLVYFAALPALICVSIIMLNITLKAEEPIPSRLAVLKSAVDSTTGGISVSKVEPVASELAAVLPTLDFSATDGISSRIEAVSRIAVGLLLSDVVRKQNLKSSDTPALSTIEKSLEAITSKVDDKWVFLLGSANIMPPPGVPNATAGMSPDAIADPKLRQQYMDRFTEEAKKGLINDQQSELRRSRDRILRAVAGICSSDGVHGWTRVDVLARFGKNKECHKILEENLNKAGK